MRHLIIDTDTASDDAVALILALREPTVKVDAITVVAGNVPLSLGVKNALISVEVANTYQPPIYAGMAKPLLRDLYTSEFVHGQDGMGNMDLPAPKQQAESEHAVDAMLRIIRESEEPLELITLGPLTNVAMAILKEPDTMKKLSQITIMGSGGTGGGNITPVAEFNVYVDAEAMKIVVESGIPLFIVGWDVSMGTTFITEEDIDYLTNTGSATAQFCVRCNHGLQEFNATRMDKIGFDLPDPATVAATLYPETVTGKINVYAEVEVNSSVSYGQVLFDLWNTLQKNPNVCLCTGLDGKLFKEKLFNAIID